MNDFEPRTAAVAAAWDNEWTVELSFTGASLADSATVTALAREQFRAEHVEHSGHLYLRIDAATAAGPAAALDCALDEVTEQLATPGTVAEARVIRKPVEVQRTFRGYRGRLATLADAARLMQETEAKTHEILHRPDAPAPLDITSAGPIWNSAEVIFYRLQHMLSPRTRPRHSD